MASTRILVLANSTKHHLMRCVAGVENWDRGSIRAGAVGYMPETIAFPVELRVRRYLRWVCSAKGVGRGWRAEVDDKLYALSGP